MFHWLHGKDIEEAAELASKPLVERESTLWAASESYMNGEISLQDLQEIEQPYLTLEYAKCVGALDAESQPSSFLGSIAQLFKSH